MLFPVVRNGRMLPIQNERVHPLPHAAFLYRKNPLCHGGLEDGSPCSRPQIPGHCSHGWMFSRCCRRTGFHGTKRRIAGSKFAPWCNTSLKKPESPRQCPKESIKNLSALVVFSSCIVPISISLKKTVCLSECVSGMFKKRSRMGGW